MFAGVLYLPGHSGLWTCIILRSTGSTKLPNFLIQIILSLRVNTRWLNFIMNEAQ